MRFANQQLLAAYLADVPRFFTHEVAGGLALPITLQANADSEGPAYLLYLCSAWGANTSAGTPVPSVYTPSIGSPVLLGQFRQYDLQFLGPNSSASVGISSPVAGAITDGAQILLTSELVVPQPAPRTFSLRIDNRAGTATVTGQLLTSSSVYPAWILREITLDLISEAVVEVTAAWQDALTGNTCTLEVMGVGSSSVPSTSRQTSRPSASINGGITLSVPVGALVNATASAIPVN